MSKKHATTPATAQPAVAPKALVMAALTALLTTNSKDAGTLVVMKADAGKRLTFELAGGQKVVVHLTERMRSIKAITISLAAGREPTQTVLRTIGALFGKDVAAQIKRDQTISYGGEKIVLDDVAAAYRAPVQAIEVLKGQGLVSDADINYASAVLSILYAGAVPTKTVTQDTVDA